LQPPPILEEVHMSARSRQVIVRQHVGRTGRGARQALSDAIGVQDDGAFALREVDADHAPGRCCVGAEGFGRTEVS